MFFVLVLTGALLECCLTRWIIYCSEYGRIDIEQSACSCVQASVNSVECGKSPS